jgi:uncharacterized protein YjiS (DUF1127 family)
MFDRPLPHSATMLPTMRRPNWRALPDAIARAVRTVVTRRSLPELEPRLLADIGVTRGEALTEAERAPWDLRPPRRRRMPKPKGSALGRTLRQAIRRWQTRRRLAEMDGRLLKDIGVSYADAELEANKPFWRA